MSDYTLSEAIERIYRLEGVIAKQDATIIELRAALKPFAVEADCWPDHHDDEPLVESFPEYDGKITVGACRRARAALERK